MAKASPTYDAKTIRFVTSLCQQLILDLRKDGADRDAIEQKFVADCCKKFSQEEGMSLAFTMINMVKVNPEYTFNNKGDVIMPRGKKTGGDNIDAGMTAGRDINSSAGGVNNKAMYAPKAATNDTAAKLNSAYAGRIPGDGNRTSGGR